jgi:2-octaprenyl-6-methoxyphenol hydroxylase
MSTEQVEVAVIGGGPAGLTAALALASAGVATVLVAPPRAADNRTTALHRGSITALETLGVWERCCQDAAALCAIRIVDDTSRLMRAPEVTFAAAELGYDAFGYSIENKHLVAALEARAAEFPAFRRIEEAATSIELGAGGVTVALAGGARVSAKLAVGADGRNSICRGAAGIAIDSRTCPQTALALNFQHTRPHHNVSTEFHTETGPFTLVPLPGLRCGLVCVVDRREAEHLLLLDDGTLAAEIERRSHSILGRIAVEPGRGAFPLEVATARAFAARRVALIGEAAHVIPPIGAQGLNLGLRDAATIGELVAPAHRDGRDLGADDLLAEYDRLRRSDIASRTLAVDLLNRSLLTDFLPVQGLRGFGLYLIDRIGPLRRALMREGIVPSGTAPRLMRGEAL